MSVNRGGTIVGALACQRDSYLRTLRTTVLRCTPVAPAASASAGESTGKKNKKKSKGEKAAAAAAAADTAEPPATTLYEVELEDTVLFPEGGGQPGDRGTLTPTDGGPVRHVLDVQRRELRAVHIVDGPLAPAAGVEVALDWRRRVDHMQQHTGQHLLSAVLDTHGLRTLGWAMGTPVCWVDVPRRLSAAELAAVAQRVEDEILANTGIAVDAGDDTKVDPDKGLMRVVKIGGLDENPCCGTHLSSVGQVQAVALLGQGRGKAGASRLSFLCGGRVPRYAAELHETTRRLMATLSSGADELDERAGGLVKQCRTLQHREKTLGREIADLHAAELLRGSEGTAPRVLTLYRPDGELEFLNNVCSAVKQRTETQGDTAGYVLVLIAGGDGAVVVAGSAGTETQTAAVVAALRRELPQLRGGGRPGRFQGKLVVGAGGPPAPSVDWDAFLETARAQLADAALT